jgi:hypothetical protein
MTFRNTTYDSADFLKFRLAAADAIPRRPTASPGKSYKAYNKIGR